MPKFAFPTNLRVFGIMIAAMVFTSCFQRHFSNGVYLRNNSSYPITAFLHAEHGDSRGDQVEAGEKHVVGVFLRKNETGVVEITDATGKKHEIPVKATDDFNAEINVEFP